MANIEALPRQNMEDEEDEWANNSHVLRRFYQRAAQRAESVSSGGSAGPKRRKRRRHDDKHHKYSTRFGKVIRNINPRYPLELLAPLTQQTSTGGLRVQVMLRICKPDNETSADERSCLRVDQMRRQVVIRDTSATTDLPAHRKVSSAPRMFAFDAVFPHSVSTGDVCETVLPDIIRSVVSGVDGCVLSYGHSRTGKSMTMVGRDSYVDDFGVIPSAIWCLFRLIQEQRERTGARFSVRVSALEISGRNERLVDLLSDASNSSEPGGGSSPGVYLNEDSAKNPRYQPSSSKCLDNHSELRASSADVAASFLDAALAQRQRTEDSRTSHFLFTLHVYQHRVERGGGLQSATGVAGGRSRLHLFDLGSGSRSSKEAGSALSLHAIGSVIMSLANGQRHIPYRDSRLSCLLREALGSLSGNICLLVHASPRAVKYNDTLQLIQLAAKIYRAAGRRRRTAKMTSNSSEDSSSCSGGGFRRSRGVNGSSDHYTSSSEQSCDTVIFCGRMSDDSLQPPRLRRALRQAEGSSASEEPLECVMEESKPHVFARTPRAAPRKLEKIHEPSINEMHIQPINRRWAEGNPNELWVDGPSSKLNQARPQKKACRMVSLEREQWVDGPHEFQVSADIKARQSDYMTNHMSGHMTNHMTNHMSRQEYKLRDELTSKPDVATPVPPEEVQLKNDLVSNWVMSLPRERHASKHLTAEHHLEVSGTQIEPTQERLDYLEEEILSATNNQVQTDDGNNYANDRDCDTPTSCDRSISCMAEPRHSLPPSFSDSQSLHSEPALKNDVNNTSLYERDFEDLLQTDEVFGLTCVDTDCNLSSLSLTESIKSGKAKLQDLPLPQFDINSLISPEGNAHFDLAEFGLQQQLLNPTEKQVTNSIRKPDGASNPNIALATKTNTKTCDARDYMNTELVEIRSHDQQREIKASSIEHRSVGLAEVRRTAPTIPKRTCSQLSVPQTTGSECSTSNRPSSVTPSAGAHSDRPKSSHHRSRLPKPTFLPLNKGRRCKSVTRSFDSKEHAAHEQITRSKERRGPAHETSDGRYEHPSSLLSPYSKVTSPRPARGASSGHGSDNSSSILSARRSFGKLLSSGGMSSGYESMIPVESECSAESPSSNTDSSSHHRNSRRRTSTRTNLPLLALVREMNRTSSIVEEQQTWTSRSVNTAQVSRGAPCVMRRRRIAELLHTQQILSSELEKTKQLLMIPNDQWSLDLHIARQGVRDDADYLQALEKETDTLEKRVKACKSHVMIVTSFDSKHSEASQ